MEWDLVIFQNKREVARMGDLKEFRGWKQVPDGYFTKTKLKESRLKPINEDGPDAYVDVYYYGWKRYSLYHQDNTVKIKKVKRRQLRTFEATEENLGQALYVINKSAKLSRDTKKEKYKTGAHGFAAKAKSRQYSLYDLKDKVIKKALEKGIAEIVGYHRQYLPELDDYNYLKLIKLGGYSFHIPSNLSEIKISKFKNLGDIGLISAEKTRKVGIKYYESLDLLNRFIKDLR
jgi:hypothetical protein